MSEKLSRFEKCEIAIEKGITCDVEAGIVYNKKGEEIGYKDKQGYVRLTIRYNGKMYRLYVHQFIYYCAKGKYDENLEIDHFNKIKDDNRIDNLRTTTTSENQQNREVKGYYWNKKRKKWKVQIQINKKSIFLGEFSKEEDAIKAREEGKKKYHTH
jgi:hypothetical protein